MVRPARPLFLGRKCCIPSTPLRFGRVNVERLRDALTHPAASRIERPRRAHEAPLPSRVRAWWPVEDGAEIGRTLAFTDDMDNHDYHNGGGDDDMDWENQLHVGRRYVQEAWVELPSRPNAREAVT